MRYQILATVLLLAAPLAHADVKKLTVDTEKSFVSWVGKKITENHDGTVKLSEGSIEMDGQKIVGGSFTIDMRSIENRDLASSPKDKAKLEGHLKSPDFFNVAEHPTGTFTVTEVIDMREGKEEGKVQFTGTLKVKDKMAPVSFPVEIKKSGELYHAEGKLTIDRSKWDIRFNSKSFFDIKKLGDKLIYDEVEIGLNILAG